jgi:adenylate kinase
MKLRYIEEPSLLFGRENHHICPKQGIYNFNPFDLEQVRPEKITLGIVGKSDSIEKILQWLDNCKGHIAEKKSKNPHPLLFPNFCGFNKQVGFLSEIVYDDTYIRKLNNSDFDEIIRKHENLEERITEIARLYLDEIKFLSKNKKPDIVLCVLSEQFITYIQEDTLEETPTEDEVDEGNEKEIKKEENDEHDAEEINEKEQNFRRYIKAKAMQHNVPIQIVRDRIAKPTGDMQDEATIAWNFFTALYYKAGGTPWALIRRDVAEHTCYAGISFFKSRDRQTTQTSIAQIFNELGKGIILRGEEVQLKKNDRTPHLSDKQAFDLLDLSLKEYYEAVKIYPTRLVLHKTSNFNQDEIYGFRQAAKKNNVHQVDLVSIQHSDKRLYRLGNYPPMRGTHMSLTDKLHVLYTRGSVPYYETYPGKYIPSPVEIKLADYDESPNVICDEILALTKMNWNNTQFDRKYPITIECARNVGEILKYVEEGDVMQLKYGFYM